MKRNKLKEQEMLTVRQLKIREGILPSIIIAFMTAIIFYCVGFIVRGYLPCP
jgi:hypothetical protein